MVFDPSSLIGEGKIGPCKALTPIVEEISNEMTEIDFGAMNIDLQPNIPTRFGRQRPYLD